MDPQEGEIVRSIIRGALSLEQKTVLDETLACMDQLTNASDDGFN